MKKSLVGVVVVAMLMVVGCSKESKMEGYIREAGKILGASQDEIEKEVKRDLETFSKLSDEEKDKQLKMTKEVLEQMKKEGCNLSASQKSSETLAAAGCGVLKNAVVSYQLKHKKLPSSLDQLCGGEDPILSNDKDLYDPWDNKYELVLKDKTRVVIRSAGPDGKMGTDDDIRSDSKRL